MPKGRGTWRRGMWSRQVPDSETGDLDAKIAVLLQPLSPDEAVWRRLAARYDADIFVGLFLVDGNEGTSLSPATLRLLVERHLRLDFDIYAG